MWKFRRIGDYYELLDGEDTLYSCKRLDSIMVDTLEDLCNRHNREIAKYDEIDVNIISCGEAYLNGLEDGKEEAAQDRYDDGYEDGYQSGKSDGYDLGYRRGLADALGKDEIE